MLSEWNLQPKEKNVISNENDIQKLVITFRKVNSFSIKIFTFRTIYFFLCYQTIWWLSVRPPGQSNNSDFFVCNQLHCITFKEIAGATLDRVCIWKSGSHLFSIVEFNFWSCWDSDNDFRISVVTILLRIHYGIITYSSLKLNL